MNNVEISLNKRTLKTGDGREISPIWLKDFDSLEEVFNLEGWEVGRSTTRTVTGQSLESSETFKLPSGDISCLLTVRLPPSVRRADQSLNPPANRLAQHVGRLCVSIQPSATGEQKTKPTQNSVRELRGLGLSPDLVSRRL